MIQETDLRIGNEVFYDGETFCTVVGIGYGKTVELAGCEGFISITDIEPIPLTPEILFNCGFEKNERCWYKEFIRENDTLRSFVFVGKLKDDPEGMYYFGFESPMHAVNINNIYFLHQLQNIYYSLTGTELNIEL